jgi:autotransporter strand-loop-strand O-heptosyltransferase
MRFSTILKNIKMGKFLIAASFLNNTEKHIEQTFQNVLNQTYQDWIFIVGDDFSDDPEFRTILKNRVVELNDPRIIYYNIESKRELYLYQNFFKEYDYDYHLTLDVDDTIDNNLLEVYNYHFQKYPNVNSIYSDYNRTDENGTLQMLSLVQPLTNYVEDFNFRHAGEFNTIYSKRSGQHMYGHARCMRRPLEDKIQIFKNCKSSNDTMFLFYNLSKGKHLHIPRRLYTYIRRKESDSGVLTPEEHKDFNINADPYIQNCSSTSSFPFNPYKNIWLETSAISSCNWLDKINEFSLITDPNIDLNLLNDLYPDKNIILNDFNHKNQIVVWGKLNNELKTNLNLNSSTYCTVFSSDENYSYPPENITEQFKISSSNFRQELNKYLTNYTWYDYFRQCIITRIMPQKLLIIQPHLSTGGCPQYLLDYLINFKDTYSEIKIVEFSNFSYDYLIQKDKIISLIGKENLITLGDLRVSDEQYIKDKSKLIPLIESFSPDIIWMNEAPEAYEYKGIPQNVLQKLYSPNRKYKIIETTHNNAFNFESKQYIPDEFMFCSPKHIKDAECINIPKKIWEVPIEKKSRPNRKTTLKKLGLDPTKHHVLNVGLFNTNKNQKYIFDLAEQTQHLPIQYHFIGNTCFFEQCGLTEFQQNLSNCKIWGERNDVDTFMSCMDLYLFPSKKELNPLTVKEALSWGMEVIANYDKNYTDQYKIFTNFHLLQDISNIPSFLSKSFTFFPKKNTYKLSFTDGAKLEILGDTPSSYEVKFYDDITNKLIHKAAITNNMWASPNYKSFIKWRIEVWVDGEKDEEYVLNLSDKKVHIAFESKSIGDTIAWFPYVEEFRKKHNCKIVCSTFHNDWFKSKYPNIEFSSPGTSVNDLYSSYPLGWFYENGKYKESHHSNNFISQPLQKTATDILGLEYKEIIPKLKNLPSTPIKEKYVTISIQSTCQAKYWNHPTGWQQVVDHLQNKGYKVAVVDQHRTFGTDGFMNTSPQSDYHFHNKPLDEVMSVIKGAEFHIGIGSGLSWLAYALNTPTVLISSFSKPWCEFQSNCIRIYKESPTSGYFNTHRMDASNWNWYPFKQINSMEDWYEIETITPKQVINQIKTIIK